MIKDIRGKLNSHIGHNIKVKYNLGRNKYENYDAIIKELYDNIFIIEANNQIKAFSYIDVLTNTIKIDY